MLVNKLELHEFFGCTSCMQIDSAIENANVLQYNVKTEMNEEIQININLEESQIGFVAKHPNGGEVEANFSGIDYLKIIQSKSGKQLMASSEHGIVFSKFSPKFNWHMCVKAIERHLRPYKRTETGRKAIMEMRTGFLEAMDSLEVFNDHME